MYANSNILLLIIFYYNIENKIPIRRKMDKLGKKKVTHISIKKVEK